MKITWCGRTHICGRPQNEDAMQAQQFSPHLYGFAVADGLGGLPAGEVASRLAVMSLFETVQSMVPKEGPVSRARMQEMLDTGFLAASAAIKKSSDADPEQAGMATTLVAALVNEKGEGVVAHAGDSRAYLAGPTLVQVSTDHSLVQEMVARGLITQEGAAAHPDRNVVTRVVSEKPVRPDCKDISLAEGTLLLCSDGLTDAMTGPEIHASLQEPDLERACTMLIERAVAAHHDNTTLIVGRAVQGT
ncbi:MAG: serine/threonine-protein phosphatase [Methanomicrobiales archaeon]|nr:serine/threonine-protein phosphatase [Methanomicrobiales archaeon]